MRPSHELLTRPNKNKTSSRKSRLFPLTSRLFSRNPARVRPRKNGLGAVSWALRRLDGKGCFRLSKNDSRSVVPSLRRSVVPSVVLECDFSERRTPPVIACCISDFFLFINSSLNMPIQVLQVGRGDLIGAAAPPRTEAARSGGWPLRRGSGRAYAA